MGWTTTAPTLPSGSSYASVGSWNTTKNKYSTAGSIAIARLATNQVSIRFTLNTNTGSTSTFAPPGYMDFKVGDSTKSYAWGANISKTVYWTGTLNKDATIATAAGAHDSGSVFSHATYLSKNAKGPAYVTTNTITYHANNGSGSTATQSKTYGSSVNLYSCGWTKTGYTFDHWDTAADGSGTDYSAGQSYSTNADLTLYAIWVQNVFTVSYNANGGTGTTESQSKEYGEDLTLRENGFAKDGSHFIEWNTAPDGSGTSYEEGGTYTQNADVTLYAIWETNTYAVTYDGNGAESGTTEPQTKTHAEPLVLRQNGFARQGYAFSGWNTAQDGTGTDYAAGGTYLTDADVTLYAQWTKTSIPVYWNDNGTIRQVDKAYANVGGTIVECDVYANIGGEIVAIL